MISSVKSLIGDDSAYLGWLAELPPGYVINTGRAPSAACLLLHRASCHGIAGVSAKGSTFTGDYSKVCSGHEELDASAAEFGGRATTDGVCMARSA